MHRVEDQKTKAVSRKAAKAQRKATVTENQAWIPAFAGMTDEMTFSTDLPRPFPSASSAVKIRPFSCPAFFAA
jgi:hypothetical protein